MPVIRSTSAAPYARGANSSWTSWEKVRESGSCTSLRLAAGNHDGPSPEVFLFVDAQLVNSWNSQIRQGRVDRWTW